MAQDTQAMQFKKVALRNELKEWERKFAETHNGQKPGREDIKADADISAKYKEYDSLRFPSKASKEPETKPAAPPPKRKASTELPNQSPTQKQRLVATPQKSRQQTEENYDSPYISRKLFTPSIKKAFIGPTPQKDGHVLGLFDLLPNETPSRTNRTPLKDVEGNLAQTPSKRAEDSEDIFTPSKRFSRTPQSSGKRFMLDMFVTPQKRRRLNEQGTPSSSHNFPATPAFLRRDSQMLEPLAEDAESPEVRRFLPRKSFGRSLSSMIAAAREEAEHEHDDEEEAMREAEGGVNFIVRKKSVNVQVKDSQMPAAVQLDQDGFVPSDVEEDEDNDQDGQPKRVWKKKGLKRQTKRVNMRPVQMKPSSRPEAQTSLEESDEDEAVPETQAAESKMAPSGQEYDSEVEVDLAHNLDDDKPKSQPKTKPSQLKKAGELVKKAAKKVNAAAHANYRRLNIKNKNSKANGRGKFGGRRR